MRRKKYHSKGTAVVTRRESGSAHGFVLQGIASEDRQVPVEVGRCCGDEVGWVSTGCKENNTGMGQGRTDNSQGHWQGWKALTEPRSLSPWL